MIKSHVPFKKYSSLNVLLNQRKIILKFHFKVDYRSINEIKELTLKN